MISLFFRWPESATEPLTSFWPFFFGINMDPTKKTRVYMNILEIKIHQPVKSGLFDFLFDI